MPHRARHPFRYWPVLVYGCIALALVLVVCLGTWGAYTELRLVRSTLLQAEIAQMRTRAVRRVGYLESGLERFAPSTNMAAMANAPWLQRYWQNMLPVSDKYLYAAIIDPAGTIVLHSAPALQGQKLEPRWYDRVAWEAGDDVYEVTDNRLAGERHAYDIRIPIFMNNQEVGEYHEGLSAAWFEQATADRERSILLRWGLVVGGVLLVVVAAVVALMAVARRSLRLGALVHLLHGEHLREVEKLAAGIVHEIRNPLHAFRLNLHALKRMHEGRAQFSPEEVQAILDESNREIERIERLLQELLNFASTEQPPTETLDLGEAVQSTLNFLKRDLTRDGIEVHTALPAEPVLVKMDAGRLRQVLLNVLLNAKEAISSEGHIDIAVERAGATALVTVKDNGAGISEKNRERIFDPFFSTKKNGSGLGLALVKRYVEEIQGTVNVIANGQTGAAFQIALPLARRANRKG